MIRLVALLAVLSCSTVATAQCANGRCAPQYRRPGRSFTPPRIAYYQSRVVVAEIPRWQAAPVVYATAQSVPVAVAPAPVEVSTDPYGFILWLNAYRGDRGRPPVVYDAYLAGLAMANCSMGFGHHGPGGFPFGHPHSRRENVGVGPGQAVWPMWTTSPAHNDALLDPTIRSVGIAYVNGVWTMNAR